MDIDKYTQLDEEECEDYLKRRAEEREIEAQKKREHEEKLRNHRWVGGFP